MTSGYVREFVREGTINGGSGRVQAVPAQWEPRPEYEQIEEGLVRPFDGGVDALPLQRSDIHRRSGQQAGGDDHANEYAQEQFPVVGDAFEY